MQQNPVNHYKIITFEGQKLPESYQALVYSKWLRSLKYGNDFFRLIDNEAYFKSYHKFIQNILQNPKCGVNLAVLIDDSDVVLGFSVYRGDVLDYVHVHKDQRGHGIGRCLLPSHIETITHLTKIGMAIWPKFNWKFNPFG